MPNRDIVEAVSSKLVRSPLVRSSSQPDLTTSSGTTTTKRFMDHGKREIPHPALSFQLVAQGEFNELMDFMRRAGPSIGSRSISDRQDKTVRNDIEHTSSIHISGSDVAHDSRSNTGEQKASSLNKPESQRTSVLAREDRLSHLEMLNRSLSMMPALNIHPSSGDSITPEKSALSIKSNSSITHLLTNKYAHPFSERGIRTLRDITQESLNELWNNGASHVRYEEFCKDMLALPGVMTQWTDDRGSIRTAVTSWRKVIARNETGTDPASDNRELEGRKLKSLSLTAQYTAINPAISLALLCLRNKDYDNFARIVAASPSSIASALLDHKSISEGPIFTDQVIWKVIAHAIPAIHQRGNSVEGDVISLSEAFDNFLCFHKSDILKEPRVRIQHSREIKSAQGKHALVNDRLAFIKNADRVWENLCPDTYADSILNTPENQAEEEASLAALMLTAVFSGIEKHIAYASKRIKDREKKISDGIEFTSASLKTGTTALPGGPINSVSELGLLISERLLQAAGSKIAHIHVDSDFPAMLSYFKNLRQCLQKNAIAGRLVALQPVLQSSWQDGISANPRSSKSDPTEVKSGKGGSHSGHHYLIENRLLRPDLPLSLRKNIQELRITRGKHLAGFLLDYGNQQYNA